MTDHTILVVRGDERVSLREPDRNRISTRLLRVAALGLLVWLLTLAPVSSGGLAQSPDWINIYSTNSMLNGEPLPIGASVAVLDSRGTECGAFTVGKEGWYGLMACYHDDPMTPKDEGAVLGERLSFTVDGKPANPVPVSLNATPVSSATRVTWSGRGDCWEIDLQAPAPVGGYSLPAVGPRLSGVWAAAIPLIGLGALIVLAMVALYRGWRARTQRRGY